uniref:Uncharacterized protein n=1 Tax=Klebsiella pneumoniae TaxID=573 RepID=A0A345WYT0_KLEPN|nr:hypothetical protein [Klebsiella pneumoniae]
MPDTLILHKTAHKANYCIRNNLKLRPRRIRRGLFRKKIIPVHSK